MLTRSWRITPRRSGCTRRPLPRASDSLSAPYYLKKAGGVYEKLGDYAKALAAYERISDDYPASMEARDIQKYIGRIQQQM